MYFLSPLLHFQTKKEKKQGTPDGQVEKKATLLLIFPI
jgi:hypothetical protein